MATFLGGGCNNPGHICQCWQRSGVHACVCTWWGCHWSLRKLNLPRSDRGRWIQLVHRGRGGGGWKEPDLISFETAIGANTQPNLGVSIQSQLVWLYYMQGIYFGQFVGIFVLFFILLSFFHFWSVWLSRASAGAAGCNFLGKQRNGTGEFPQLTCPLRFFLAAGAQIKL